MLEIFGAILGLIYIFLEFRASIHLWIVGAIMPIVYAIVYFQADLYAQGGIQLYYVAAAIYGWGRWRRKKNEDGSDAKEIAIGRMTMHWFKNAIILGALISIPIYFLLSPFSDPMTAKIDALIAGLSIVAMFLLALKVAEQWLMWFFVDVICCGLYLYLSLYTDTQLYATAGLYALYSILAIWGYCKWKKIADSHEQKEEQNHHEIMSINNAIILAHGNYPTHAIPQAMLHSDIPVVCCDGAANRFVEEGGTPLAIVGDGDSLSPTVRERFSDIIYCVAEQETNDLTKTVNFATSKGCKQISILGGTGLRECHTLGNISLLMDYHRKGLKVDMVTDHCHIIPCSNTVTLPTTRGQQVSIINFGAKGLIAEGLAYPIYDFQQWWQGTLNEATAEQITIHAEGDYLVLLDFVE
jgi:thiamine pyrophosphokinase